VSHQRYHYPLESEEGEAQVQERESSMRIHSSLAAADNKNTHLCERAHERKGRVRVIVISCAALFIQTRVLLSLFHCWNTTLAGIRLLAGRGT
jgi:hypothetical protein